MDKEELQAPEPVSKTDTKLSECNHLAGSWVPVTLLDKSWNYCPKCGEKL